MRTLAGLGAFCWGLGVLVLVVNVFGDSGTPQLTHVDTLGLGLAVSGAILAIAGRDDPRS